MDRVLCLPNFHNFGEKTVAGIKLTETDSVQAIRHTLAIASAQARYEATLYMRGELKELSEPVKTELGGLVTGYICAAKSGAGR